MIGLFVGGRGLGARVLISEAFVITVNFGGILIFVFGVLYFNYLINW